MREYVFSASILSALTAGLRLLRKTLRSPLSWHVGLLWASWVISLVIAFDSVRHRSQKDNK